jgi:hypothetical protein
MQQLVLMQANPPYMRGAIGICRQANMNELYVAANTQNARSPTALASLQVGHQQTTAGERVMQQQQQPFTSATEEKRKRTSAGSCWTGTDLNDGRLHMLLCCAHCLLLFLLLQGACWPSHCMRTA